MSVMTAEWTDRLKHWIRTLKDDLYQPIGDIHWEMSPTMEEISSEEAEKLAYIPVEPGFTWGHKYEYGWFRADITLPEQAQGKRIAMDLQPDGESTIFVNGKAFGTYRAKWLKEAHHFIEDNCLTLSAEAGETYHVQMETYAGQYYPEAPTGGCATGPVLPGSYQDPAVEGHRVTLGHSTYGIWNEDAYQLYMDVATLSAVFQVIDPNSLRAAKIADGLQQFTLTVDFEQDQEGRNASYRKAREELKPLMQARNGSTMPVFYAVGNSHLDLAWLWPMAETYRKTARTFAAQLRLLDEYPDYVYIQSQPASYEMCRQYYPELFERIKKAIKDGRWIADGAMWVEPDTNMSSGEALIRQILYGKRYYKNVLGVDSVTLWLPDTFGYSGVLPQILKSCGVKYLVTQKIFWSYNQGEQFPYHYFNWEGIDGTQVVSFLPTSYTYWTNPADATKVWNERVQKRDLEAFLYPYGYGDGGGGPARDYLEYVKRQENLEGAVPMKQASPRQFFEDIEKLQGKPKNTYRGELYFTAHRGTYTSQALIKRNNRKGELSLREMEYWASLAQSTHHFPYPKQQAEKLWKELLLHQFHDILPGSGIGEIYREAETRVGKVIQDSQEETAKILASLTKPSENLSVFNSLSFARSALVDLPEGMNGAKDLSGKDLAVLPHGNRKAVLVNVPASGATTIVPQADSPAAVSAPAVTEARVIEKNGGFELSNGHLSVMVDQNGEITSYKTSGSEREFAAGAMNHFEFYQDIPRLFDAWDVDSNYVDSELPGARNVKVSVLRSSGADAALLAQGTIGQSSYRQEIVLEAGANRVEFRTTVDWKELHRLLKVAFPVSVYTDNVINEIQFGYVLRPNHRSRQYDKDRFEVCNHHFSAFNDGNHGAAVLNDCKYGMSANGNKLELTLLRASACPEMKADNHVHEFTYALTCFEGSFVSSDVVRQGWDLNVPVRTVSGTAGDFSAFTVGSDSGTVYLDTVKEAEDSDSDLFLRLYESSKCAAMASVHFGLPVKKVYVCNMMEEQQEELPVENGTVRFPMHDFEIKTLKVQF